MFLLLWRQLACLYFMPATETEIQKSAQALIKKIPLHQFLKFIEIPIQLNNQSTETPKTGISEIQGSPQPNSLFGKVRPSSSKKAKKQKRKFLERLEKKIEVLLLISLRKIQINDPSDFNFEQEIRRIGVPVKTNKFESIITRKWGIIMTHFLKKQHADNVDNTDEDYKAALQKTLSLIMKLKINSMIRSEVFNLLNPQLYTQIMEIHVDLSLREIFTHSDSIFKIKHFYEDLDIDLGYQLENLFNYMSEMSKFKVVKIKPLEKLRSNEKDKIVDDVEKQSSISGFIHGESGGNNNAQQVKGFRSVKEGARLRYASSLGSRSCYSESDSISYEKGVLACCEGECQNPGWIDCPGCMPNFKDPLMAENLERVSNCEELVDILSLGGSFGENRAKRKGSCFSFENLQFEDF